MAACLPRGLYDRPEQAAIALCLLSFCPGFCMWHRQRQSVGLCLLHRALVVPAGVSCLWLCPVTPAIFQGSCNAGVIYPAGSAATGPSTVVATRFTVAPLSARSRRQRCWMR